MKWDRFSKFLQELDSLPLVDWQRKLLDHILAELWECIRGSYNESMNFTWLLKKYLEGK